MHSLPSRSIIKRVKKRDNQRPENTAIRLNELSLLKRVWFSPAPKAVSNITTLIEVFAAFLIIDDRVEANEANIALDLLRHSYPEADHGWLARQLQRALEQPKSTAELAASIASDIPITSIPSLALQIYLLVEASNLRRSSRKAFLRLMEELDHAELGTVINQELSEEAQEHLPFNRVIFGHSPNADVQLPAAEAEYSFHIYRSEQTVIIKNTCEKTIWLGGTALFSDQIMRLRRNHRLDLPNWTLTASDIHFFLDAHRQGSNRSLYLYESDEGLIIDRTRSRLSTIQLDLGTRALLTVIKPTKINLEYQSLLEGTPVIADYHDHLILSDHSQIPIERMRRQAMDAGGRFKLEDRQQTILVSNDPTAIKKSDLLISQSNIGKILLSITFDPQKSEGTLKILQAERPIIINNQAYRAHHPDITLPDGTYIRITSSLGVRCRFSDGIIDEEKTIIRELKVEGLNHEFNPNAVALNNLDFTVNRGEMLCIIGPSGCGKSTLLSTISGQLQPTRGHIRLNGISLYMQRERLAPFISYMPQEEALNSNLTVREHLSHACAIRRPHHSQTEKSRRVDSILAELSLQPLAHRKVGSPGDKSISGGERSRLNLGLDLSSLAEILLFDEPISGLSSKDSEHVAETLKALSQDKIVIASLHRPGASVLSLFDKVLLLDKGGRIAYFGTPEKMFHYFWEACQEYKLPLRKRYRNDHESGADFVFDVLETPVHNINSSEDGTFARRFPPSFWQERYESHRLMANVEASNKPVHSQMGELSCAEDNMPIPIARKYGIKDHLSLFLTHLKRSFLSKFRNRGTLYATVLEAPLLAALIALTLRASEDGDYQFGNGYHFVTYLFLSVTVGMFLGLTNSATEVLRDKPILRRERNHRYNTAAYLLAKFANLSLLCIVQSTIYVTVGSIILDTLNMWFYHWAWMSVTAIAGTAIALLISSIVKSERAALSAVPLLLVPQLLLAGALVPFQEMNPLLFQGGEQARKEGAEPFPARLMPLRYAYEGIVLTQHNHNFYAKRFAILDRQRESLKKYTNAETGADVLTDEQAERLATLKLAVTRLEAAEAPNKAAAMELCETITQLGLNSTRAELAKIQVRSPNVIYPTCQSYFHNERLRLLVKKANIQRSNNKYENAKEGNNDESYNSIFLEKYKYLFRTQIRTVWWCFTILGLIISTCLILSITVLTRWNRRVTS